jgi:hypothetical protein
MTSLSSESKFSNLSVNQQSGHLAKGLSGRNISTSGSTSGGIPTALGLPVRTIGVDTLIDISDAESKTGRINIAMAPKKQGAKHRLGKEVQDAVEDGLRVGRDDIASLADTPGNGVENP